MEKAVLRIRDEVAFRKADDGTMTIVSPVTDKIVTINAAAAELWDLIDGKSNMDEIAGEFISRHREDENFPGEGEAANHVNEILEQFLKKEFIEQIA